MRRNDVIKVLGIIGGIFSSISTGMSEYRKICENRQFRKNDSSEPIPAEKRNVRKKYNTDTKKTWKKKRR